jgi:hypothetical protein
MAHSRERTARFARIWLIFAAAALCSLALITAESAHAAKCTKKGTNRGDYIKGTKKKDVICGLGGDDVLIGVKGNDVLIGGPGNDELQGGVGNDKLTGSGGTDSASYSASATGVNVDLVAKSATGEGTDTLSSIENAKGSIHADTLRGDAAANSLDAGAGNDSLAGGPGDDALAGGADEDNVTYAGASGSVSADLGAGTAFGDGADTLTGVEELYGSAQADALHGDGADNNIAGGDGDDTITGGGGDDTLAGGEGNDQIHGDDADDSLAGGPGDDLLDGGPGINACDGGGEPGDQLLNNCDSSAPVLASFTVNPATVDTSAQARDVTVTLQITDDLSGVDAAASEVDSTSPTGGPGPGDQLHLASGTATNGTYTATITVPRLAPDGTWDLDLHVVDAAGNQLTMSSADLIAAGFPGSFNQTGIGDSTAPSVSQFDVSPTSIDTSQSGQDVTITLHATDALSGVDTVGSTVALVPPDGGAPIQAQLQRTSGDASDGDYQAIVSVPQGSVAGAWGVDVVVADQAGNQTSVNGGFDQVGDASAPTIASLSVLPETIDTTNDPKTVVVSMHLNDDLSGVDAAASHVVITSPSGAVTDQQALQLNSGDGLDGVYEADFSVPMGSERGTWTLSVTLVDQNGNQRTLTSAQLQNAGLPNGFLNDDVSAT